MACPGLSSAGRPFNFISSNEDEQQNKHIFEAVDATYCCKRTEHRA